MHSRASELSYAVLHSHVLANQIAAAGEGKRTFESVPKVMRRQVKVISRTQPRGITDTPEFGGVTRLVGYCLACFFEVASRRLTFHGPKWKHEIWAQRSRWQDIWTCTIFAVQ